jgi:archaellum component FlaC
MSNKKMDEALRTFLFEHDALKAQNEWLVGEIQKQATKVAVLRKADEENRQLKQAIERLERYQGESTDIINAQRKKRSELEEKIKGLEAKVELFIKEKKDA